MAVWGVAEAETQFSAVLDKAESEGPQLVTRRGREFLVMAREGRADAEGDQATGFEKPFVSAWDALRPSSGELFDVDFPRSKSKARAARF